MNISLEELTPFVFGYCMAMVFWQRERLAIHCSAVKLDGKAVLICGGSGSGKSTLTAKLLDNGGKLMTDDVAIVDFNKDGDVLVYPAFPQQKLCRDAAVNPVISEALMPGSGVRGTPVQTILTVGSRIWCIGMAVYCRLF